MKLKILNKFIVTISYLAMAAILIHVRAAGQDYITATVAQKGDADLAAFDNPTTLAIAPDGRLFVGQSNGLIRALTLDGIHVTSVQTINVIYNRGSAPGVPGRLVTGIAFGPVGDLFVSHSDVRIYNTDIVTNSGTVTRVYASTGFTAYMDIVTGLPRSKADHAPNGLAFGPDGALYLAIGGFTNAGRPSDFFKFGDEQPYSSAILRIDIGTGAYTRYATGFRNPYDLVWHSNGNLYATDNGANDGAGNTTNSSCGEGSNPESTPDELNRIISGKYYGHPNPARGECIFNSGTNYTAPIATFGASVDGIAAYTSSRVPSFQGNLFAVNFNSGEVYRIQLSPSGASVSSSTTYASGFNQPLDLAISSDGRIYVAEFGGNKIKVILPTAIFRSYNNYYVVAEFGGGDEVNANRAVIGPWEKFAIIDINGGSLQSGDPVYLLTADGTHYVVAESGGAPEGTPPPSGRVYANRLVGGPWETFIIRKADGSGGAITNNTQISLQSYNGYYVVAENGGAAEGSTPPAGQVFANRVAVGPWETFTLLLP